MLAAGAAERDRQIALAFADIVRHEIDEQFGNSINELFSLRELTNVGSDFGVLACQRTELRHEVRVRQKTNIEYQIGIAGHAVLEAEAHAGNENAVAAAFPILKLFEDVGAQLVDVELGCINDDVGQIADEIELFALRTNGRRNRRTLAQRMRPSRLAEAPHERLV